MTGVELIAQERERQINKEGWTPEHDDDHELGEMAVAAACYAVSGLEVIVATKDSINGVDAFPWDPSWDKRNKHDRKRQLVIAGALIAAEIDRLIRDEEYKEEYRELLRIDPDDVKDS